jgi:hypothetical protein
LARVLLFFGLSRPVGQVRAGGVGALPGLDLRHRIWGRIPLGHVLEVQSPLALEVGLGPALELVGAAGQERHGATPCNLLLIEPLDVPAVLFLEIGVDLQVLHHFLMVVKIFLLFCHVLFIMP